MNKYDLLGIVSEGAYGIVYKSKNKEAPEEGTIIHPLIPQALTRLRSSRKQTMTKLCAKPLFVK